MLWAFSLSVLLTVLGVVSILAVTLALGRAEHISYADATLPHLPLLLAVGLGVAILIGLGSLYKIAQLKSGGGVVAQSLGGVRVSAETRDPRERRLRNVVEEIAIASGVPVPEIYLLEHEAGINAFAAGYTPSDAAVAVTRGALEQLSRDELQGVIAHEFSHILNGDMRLNIWLMGLLFGLLLIHIIGREIVEHSPRGAKRGGSLAALGFGLMAVGWLGLISARLIKARLSRQREYLADASAVQFTRQATGISTALQKIAVLEGGALLAGGRGEEVSHMLFGDGVGYSRLFSTHPPLLERIQRIEPQVTATVLKVKAARWKTQQDLSGVVGEEPAVDLRAPVMAAAATTTLLPRQVVEQVGHPSADDYRYAEHLHATLPEPLRVAAHSPVEAPALLLALLMDRREAMAVQQRERIRTVRGAAEMTHVDVLYRSVENLPPALRLPLAALAFPTLRARPATELAAYQALVGQLVRADGHVGLFEFVLARLLRVQLEDWLHPAQGRAEGTLRLVAAQDEAALLLAVLADAGTRDRDTARRAWQAGWAHLWPQSTRAPSLPLDWPAALDAALDRLDTLQPLAKQWLIEALVKTLAHDGRVSIGEAELLRVVTASLHCPLPPALSGKP